MLFSITGVSNLIRKGPVWMQDFIPTNQKSHQSLLKAGIRCGSCWLEWKPTATKMIIEDIEDIEGPCHRLFQYGYNIMIQHWRPLVYEKFLRKHLFQIFIKCNALKLVTIESTISFQYRFFSCLVFPLHITGRNLKENGGFALTVVPNIRTDVY